MPSIRYILLFISLLSFNYVAAQVSFGLKGGINLAQQNIQDIGLDIDSDEITGYNLGGFLEIPIGNGNIYFQPEILLIQKGGSLSLNVSDIRTTINYIDVPILLKLKILNSNLFNVNVLGGPSFGYATNGEEVENGTVINLNFGEDNIKRFDVGIHAGAGLALELGSVAVIGDIRYLFGLSDLDGSDRAIKNRGILLSAGLQFRILGRRY